MKNEKQNIEQNMEQNIGKNHHRKKLSENEIRTVNGGKLTDIFDGLRNDSDKCVPKGDIPVKWPPVQKQ